MTGIARRLVLLRHAKAAWPEDVADADRPLASRGKHDAPAAGQWLAEHVPAIDITVCSTALRAQQTWNLVSPELSGQPLLRPDDRLYGASAEQLLEVVRMLPDEARTAVVVAHNPGLEELTTLLTGQPHELGTAGIVVLACPENWAATATRTAWIIEETTPRGE